MIHKSSLSLSFKVMGLEQSMSRINLIVGGWTSEIDIKTMICHNKGNELIQTFKRVYYKSINSFHQRCDSLILESKVNLPSLEISSWNCSLDDKRCDILEEIKGIFLCWNKGTFSCWNPKRSYATKCIVLALLTYFFFLIDRYINLWRLCRSISYRTTY